jgi:hypothetical protein
MALEPAVPVTQFSKDHWSTLAFVETRCVDDRGRLDKTRMRCNSTRHAAFADRTHTTREWTGEYGTLLKDGTKLPDHDDWDCLIDLARAGLLDIITIDDGLVALTERGWAIAHQLRRHLAAGGNCKGFEPEPLPVGEEGGGVRVT